MTNAKEELLKAIDKLKIKCASISNEYDWEEDSSTNYTLKLNYNKEEYDKFLESLNFNYDSGYGGQSLFGTVWIEDGTWLSRGEYDGSEWWDHNGLPAIPNECL